MNSGFQPKLISHLLDCFAFFEYPRVSSCQVCINSTLITGIYFPKNFGAHSYSKNPLQSYKALFMRFFEKQSCLIFELLCSKTVEIGQKSPFSAQKHGTHSNY